MKIYWKYCGYYVFTALCNVLPKDRHVYQWTCSAIKFVIQQSHVQQCTSRRPMNRLWCTHQNLSFVVARTKMNAFSLLPTRQMQTIKPMRDGIRSAGLAYTAVLNWTKNTTTKKNAYVSFPYWGVKLIPSQERDHVFCFLAWLWVISFVPCSPPLLGVLSL
jgi:hypothetical protein